MTLHVYDKLEQGSPEWHAARRGMVTASVVGGLLSVRTMGALEYDCPNCDAPSDYPCIDLRKQTPMKGLHTGRTTYANEHADSSPLIVEPGNGKEAHGLTALLTAERITNWTHEPYVNDDMQRGNLYEPIAVEMYSERYEPVTTVGFMVLEEDGWRLGFSPDGLVGTDGLIEVKAPRQKGHLTTVISDRVPSEHLAQIQAGLLVSGRKWLDFISICAGMAPYVKRVFPDPCWFKAITAAVKQFETNSAEMVATYNARTEGLPMTDRIEFEDVVI